MYLHFNVKYLLLTGVIKIRIDHWKKTSASDLKYHSNKTLQNTNYPIVCSLVEFPYELVQVLIKYQPLYKVIQACSKASADALIQCLAVYTYPSVV